MYATIHVLKEKLDSKNQQPLEYAVVDKSKKKKKKDDNQDDNQVKVHMYNCDICPRS